jgi:hypothetical protein
MDERTLWGCFRLARRRKYVSVCVCLCVCVEGGAACVCMRCASHLYCASCAGAAGCVARGVLCNNAVCWCTARAVWSPSLQLACDVLRGGVPLGSGRSQVRLWWHVAAAAACGRSGRSRGVLFRQPNCLWQIQTSGKMLSLPLRLRRALRESFCVCAAGILMLIRCRALLVARSWTV